MKYTKFTSFDNTILVSYLWDDVRAPKGIVQISHGMAEHARRYDDFAKYLNANGYLVYADDHRAHGNTEKKINIGYHDGDIYNDTIKDEIEITKYLKEKYNVPLVYFGHSYGSFLGQGYLQQNNGACGVILTGSARMPGGIVSAGAAVSKMMCKLSGAQKKGEFMNKLSFGSYNSPFKKEGHAFAWLSRDAQQVRKYFDDEQCGYVMSNAFYKSFMSGLKSVYKPENLSKIDKNSSIALFSGEADPVGGKRASYVKKLFAMYKSLGINSVTLKVYPEARHEILNETNNKEVYADILLKINEFIAK
ncbi:MAG: alpha/beta hydrolase [Clostridia bacterium]